MLLKSQPSTHLPASEDVVWAQLCWQKWALVILAYVSRREDVKPAYLDHLSPYLVSGLQEDLQPPQAGQASHTSVVDGSPGGQRKRWAPADHPLLLVAAPMAYCYPVLDTFTVKCPPPAPSLGIIPLTLPLCPSSSTIFGLPIPCFLFSLFSFEVCGGQSKRVHGHQRTLAGEHQSHAVCPSHFCLPSGMQGTFLPTSLLPWRR